jgi:integrase
MKAGESQQRAFKPDELKRLCEALRPFAMTDRHVHYAWLPLVALYTGARVNEICQLNPHTDETDGDGAIRKSIKNATSRRKVPIHSALLQLGFMDYVAARRASGGQLLFPWKPSKGKASYNAEKWFRGFLRDSGLRDETPRQRLVGMHAFRSTFLNRAHNLRISGAECITGHAGTQSAVVRGYQGELELQVKRDIIEKITFDIDPPVPVAPDARSARAAKLPRSEARAD